MNVAVGFLGVFICLYAVNGQRSRQLFEIPNGCSGGSNFAHDGGCIEPFKLKLNTSTLPDITSRFNTGNKTLSSNRNGIYQTTRRPGAIVGWTAPPLGNNSPWYSPNNNRYSTNGTWYRPTNNATLNRYPANSGWYRPTNNSTLNRYPNNSPLYRPTNNSTLNRYPNNSPLYRPTNNNTLNSFPNNNPLYRPTNNNTLNRYPNNNPLFRPVNNNARQWQTTRRPGY